MKRTRWSVPILLLLPVLGAAADPVTEVETSQIIGSPDVDKLLEGVADWSREIAPPPVDRRIRKILFCKLPLAVEVVGLFDTKSCRTLLFASGGVWKPGYARFADADGTDTQAVSAAWFRVTPRWDSELKSRKRIKSEEAGLFSPAQRRYEESHSLSPRDDGWRAPTPGNSGDPRNDRGQH